MMVVFFDPGDLRHRVTLEQRTETSDGCGGVLESWILVSALWAAVRPKQTVSGLQAQQMIERVEHEIVVRFRPDIQSGWRFKLNERCFEILSLHDPDETGRYLICRTSEEGK